MIITPIGGGKRLGLGVARHSQRKSSKEPSKTQELASLETEKMNRVEMCLAAATPAGASVRRVARAGGRARRWRRAALAPARGRAGPGGVQSAREASVLSLGGVSRALFAFGHADSVWWQLVECDFPDVEAVARPLRGRVAGDPYGGGARRARGGGRLARALGRALLHLRRVVVATSYRDDAMALGWRMPQRAPTPDLQTPGRSATHTFEPPCAPSSS